MSNPFEAPMTPGRYLPPGGSTGDFDIGVAFQDGMAAMQRNWLGYIGAFLAVGFVVILSILMCFLPALAVIPVVTWGFVRFELDTLDGQAEVGTIFEPFNRMGQVLVPMLITIVLMLLVSAPGLIASFVLQFGSQAAANNDPMAFEAVVGQLLGTFVSTAWSMLVVVRFLPMSFLVVDQGMAPLDAFAEAWRLTSTCWGKLVLFSLATIVANVVGLLLCCVGMIPASMVVASAQASVYRQIAGRR